MQTTEEGGAQAKEYIAIYAADRVRNVSGVWMGQTVGCAQCHDHKYDPITTKDFYAMAAFFADIKEKGVYEAGALAVKVPFHIGDWGPTVAVPTPEQDASLKQLDAQIDSLKQRLGALKERMKGNASQAQGNRPGGAEAPTTKTASRTPTASADRRDEGRLGRS